MGWGVWVWVWVRLVFVCAGDLFGAVDQSCCVGGLSRLTMGRWHEATKDTFCLSSDVGAASLRVGMGRCLLWQLLFVRCRAVRTNSVYLGNRCSTGEYLGAPGFFPPPRASDVHWHYERSRRCRKKHAARY